MEETVRVNSDGRSTPGLAEKQTWLDDKTLQIKLRKNVEFQDGEKLNATTFRRSYDEVQRWVNPHPPGAFLNFAKDSSMEVVDDHTINFKFPEPDGSAIMKLRVCMWEVLNSGMNLPSLTRRKKMLKGIGES